ncbi:hypothetical protein PTKIN_Ptkin09bG0189400 [Pterospermum kingtungense]
MQTQISTLPSSSEIKQQLGLEALSICPKKSQTEKHCSSCMMTSSVVSPSASSLIGDYIGMESCFDLDDNNNQDVSGGGGDGCVNNNDYSGVCSQGCEKRDRRMTSTTTTKREFPPPIRSLARSDNLPSHMPWVLKRYYTSDGRLILREEKVRHHEYLRAHRSNGRLTLHLVPLDDNIDDIEDYDEIDDDEEEEEKAGDSSNVVNNASKDDDDDDDHKSNILETLLKDNDIPMIEDSLMKSSIAETPIDNGINAAATNGGKCLNYSSVRASPTFFVGMPVPAMRPVHS